MVGRRHHRVDRSVEVDSTGQEVRDRLPDRVVVAVQRDVVDGVVALREDRGLPACERRHAAVRAAARDQLHPRVGQLHRPGGPRGQCAVVGGAAVADLPGSVHLVAQAPQAHVVRLGGAMGAAQVRETGAARVVAVLQEVDRLLRPAGPEVDREHRLGPDLAAPGDELAGAERVGLDRVPGQVQAAWPLRVRSDPVLPAVAGDEVAAGVAQHGGAQLADQVQHVGAVATLVGVAMPRLEEPGVHAPAQVLDERAEEPGVDRTDAERRVEGDGSGEGARRGGRHEDFLPCRSASGLVPLGPAAEVAARLRSH